MSRRSENFKRSVQIGLAFLTGGLPLIELACDQAPAIVEPAAGNGIPDLDPTALPQAAPTEARVAPDAAPIATSTVESQPSPTPTMVPLESLDGSYTSEQQALADLTFEKVVKEAVVSGDTKLKAYELNGTIFYKDADSNNPRLNLDYGRDATNVTVIVADQTLEAGYYILRVSEINDDLEAHNLPRSVVDFNVDPSGKFLGVDAQGKTLATRNTFQKADGTQAAVFVPEGATLTYDENNLLNGYEFNGIRYSFNPDTGGFTKEPIAPPTPAPEFGMRRQNPDTNQQEYYFGEWVTPPVVEGFDPAHIVLENNQIHYRSEGLTQIWSAEQLAWVFPDVFPYKVGEVVPVSLMGGRLEIADQAAAWQAHQDMVLAWLNNPGNAEFLQAVYAKSNISWEDLRAADESGQTKYEINLIGLNGEMIWPEVIIISNTGDVRYWTLADYIDDKATFGTKIDVSSPLWIVAGPQNWTEQGVSDFVDQRLDGSDTFGNSWSSHGLLLTPSGRLAWTAISKNPSSRFETSHIPLGGTSGTEINPDLVQAYVASTIKTYYSIEKSTRSIRAIPLYAGTTEGITTANTSGANTIEEAYTILPDRIFRNIP